MTHNIAAELREIATRIARCVSVVQDERRLREFADALEAQQAAHTDLAEWQRELMRLNQQAMNDYRAGAYGDLRHTRELLQSHAAQMVQRVAHEQSNQDNLRQEVADLREQLAAALSACRHETDVVEAARARITQLEQQLSEWRSAYRQ